MKDKHTEESKLKISNSLKKAFKEGRAHGWANVKQNKNGMSYPEVWFEKMIKNENLDLNYEYNFTFFKYKLDFAWTDKRLCIEIDGNQHNEETRKESDIKKDLLLKENGWKVLRLKWGYIVAHTKESIDIVKKFLQECGDVTIPLYETCEEINKKIRLKNKLNNVQVDSTGRYNHKKLSNKKLLERKQQILNSGVDLSKFGWVSKVEKQTGLSKRQINLIVNTFEDLKEKVFYKKYNMHS